MRCGIPYVLHPASHTIVDRAHLVFRPGDLRPDTQIGTYLDYQIRVDPIPEGLMPLVIMGPVNGVLGRAWFARPTGYGTWDAGVRVSPPLPAEAEVRIYLLVR
jgi:hypothetical protein